jgi:hypothetical protein
VVTKIKELKSYQKVLFLGTPWREEMFNGYRITFSLIFVLALTACGQSGPLYLPQHKEAQTSHVE